MILDLREKTTRVDDAYLRLKKAIRSSALSPNEQLTEPEIANRLGMSRTPVREALIRLSSDGLVRLIPRHGALILPVTKNDMEEIYDILMALEPAAAAKLAARKPSTAELEPLKIAVEAMEAAVAEGDLVNWANADDEFHEAFLSLQGNGRIVTMVSALNDQAHRARMMTLDARSIPVKSTNEHREILDNLIAGNAEGARSAFERHRRRAAQELLALM